MKNVLEHYFLSYRYKLNFKCNLLLSLIVCEFQARILMTVHRVDQLVAESNISGSSYHPEVTAAFPMAVRYVDCQFLLA
jgi:hypothetical protein